MRGSLAAPIGYTVAMDLLNPLQWRLDAIEGSITWVAVVPGGAYHISHETLSVNFIFTAFKDPKPLSVCFPAPTFVALRDAQAFCEWHWMEIVAARLPPTPDS